MEEIYYQKVDIPNIAQLQKDLDESLTKHNINEMCRIKDSKYDFYEQIYRFKLLNKHPVWDGLMLKDGIFFFLEKNTIQGVHVDGFRADRKDASDMALNIPIRNCGIGSMDWYGGPKYTLEEKTVAESRRTKYLKLNWESKPEVVASVTIDTPHLVRIDRPHQAKNLCPDKPRVMLSIRFTPDLKWL